MLVSLSHVMEMNILPGSHKRVFSSLHGFVISKPVASNKAKHRLLILMPPAELDALKERLLDLYNAKQCQQFLNSRKIHFFSHSYAISHGSSWMFVMELSKAVEFRPSRWKFSESIVSKNRVFGGKCLRNWALILLKQALLDLLILYWITNLNA